jgi:hypothetical protein
MIAIKRSPTADTRTCDVTTVSKRELFESSAQHIQDVRNALYFFRAYLQAAGDNHDGDKLTDIDQFYHDFQTKFTSTVWWDLHRKITRHHLNYRDGVPANVNLLDVLEFIADGVMAGAARSGKENVYMPALTDEVLRQAFTNTFVLLMDSIRVEP